MTSPLETQDHAATPAVGPLSWPRQPKVKLGMMGAEPALSETEQAFQTMAHAFAADVMRPVGQALDRLTPEQVMAKDSPYWGFCSCSWARHCWAWDLRPTGGISSC